MAVLLLLSALPLQEPEVVEDRLPGVLAGRVVDPEGNPVAGATVDAWTRYPRNEATTDAEGRFAVPNLDGGGKPDVKVTAPGRTPVYVPQQPFGEDIEYVLGDDTYLEGVVAKPDGTPAAGVEVLAQHGPINGNGVRIGEVTFSAKTDFDGRYRLYAPALTYEMQVVAAGVGFAREAGVAARGATTWDATLKRGATLRAEVRDAVTGEPFEGLCLYTWQKPKFSAVSDRDGVLLLEGLPDGEREFDVCFGEPTRENLMSGRPHGPMGRWWSPEAMKKWEREEVAGGRFQRNLDGLTFEIPEDGLDVTIEVERGVTLSGRVTDPDGDPVEGVTVAPAKTGSGNSLTGDTRYSVTTDADGRYESVIPAPKDAKVNLVAHDGGYDEWRTWANARGEAFSADPGETVPGMDFTLARPGMIRGRVEGAAVGTEVRAVPTDGRSHRYYVPTGRTLEDGSFEIRFVSPGEQMVQVAPFWLDPTQAPEGSSRTVTIDEGGELDGVTLQSPR